MMRWLVILVSTLMSAGSVYSQITITADDMPVLGDSLRFSNANALGAMAYIADSGAGMSWNYALTPTSQGIDNYKKPSQINPLLALTISNPNCYGYKIADSIPGIGFLLRGITISNLHTFFSKITTPPCFAAEAFCATITGFPIGASYIVPDAWYMFPLDYNDNDSSDFYLKFGAATFGSIKQKGYRKNRVDGWGTITTPYFTTPTNCIRVRSEIVEVDSVVLDTISFGIPRTTVEYKWLVKGQHYPALWVTALSISGAEIVTGVKYRDAYRPEFNSSIKNTTTGNNNIFAYPIPATDGWVNFELPNSWTNFTIELFDAQGRSAGFYQNKRKLDVSTLPSGNYIARLTSDEATAYVKIVR